MKKNNIVEVFQHEKDTAQSVHGPKLKVIFLQMVNEALTHNFDMFKLRTISTHRPASFYNATEGQILLVANIHEILRNNRVKEGAQNYTIEIILNEIKNESKLTQAQLNYLEEAYSRATLFISTGSFEGILEPILRSKGLGLSTTGPFRGSNIPLKQVKQDGTDTKYLYKSRYRNLNSLYQHTEEEIEEMKKKAGIEIAQNIKKAEAMKLNPKRSSTSSSSSSSTDIVASTSKNIKKMEMPNSNINKLDSSYSNGIIFKFEDDFFINLIITYLNKIEFNSNSQFNLLIRLIFNSDFRFYISQILISLNWYYYLIIFILNLKNQIKKIKNYFQ